MKRIVNGTETWQVYGLGGELLAEYAANTSSATPQKEYGYRNGQLLITATVTSGWGSPPTISDNPLGVSVTPVQATHITELRVAINALRTHLAMPAYSWQYSATTKDWISANPILEMRTALDEALGAPPLGYSSGLGQYEPIKATHIQELRDRVLAAWTSGSSTAINWLVSDHLGTPRMTFDQTGSLATMKRHDYLPFGEELSANQGLRTPAQGYMADNVRQKFTQKERDNETGLDYFGARYYSSMQGRFTSSDPAPIKPKTIRDPRDLNRYAYVSNSPLRYVDPTGEEKFEIILRTYIPYPTIKYPPKVGPTFNGNVDNKGQRLPGKEGFKTEHRVVIDTDRNSPAELSKEHNVGPTHRVGRGLGNVIGPSEGTANGKTLSEYATRYNETCVTAHIKGNESNPLLVASPGISYHFEISISSTGPNNAAWLKITGTHDGFPAYEVVIVRPEAGTTTVIPIHDPSQTGDTPARLGPPEERSVNREMWLEPKKKQ